MADDLNYKEESDVIPEPVYGGMEDLPDALIVTNIGENVFENDRLKEEFEAVFLEFDDSASFQYFKSFRRVRVNYSCPALAARARIHLNETEICGQCVKCYFVQSTASDSDPSSPHLQPPPVPKQYLISPPASPPVGWEQSLEARPVINYDLLSAIAQLAPGQAHEVHPPSKNQPGIVVHVCEDPEGYLSKPKTPIVQTRRPEKNS
ncbi:hypothetical protein ScPMuIL_012470 [Solemya velum]